MEEWIDHFRVQMNGTMDKRTGKYEKIGEKREEIRSEEIKNAISRLKKKKAAGEDKIPNEAWIYGVNEISTDLEIVMNRIWNGEEDFPEEWKTGIVTPIFKKGNKDEAKNYRGITLMDTGYKIYAEILKNRLEDEIEEKKSLSGTQFGYRKHKGTIDAIYLVKTAIEEEIRKEKGEIFMFFADMKGAFDKLKRGKIWKIMEQKKIKQQTHRRNQRNLQ